MLLTIDNGALAMNKFLLMTGFFLITLVPAYAQDVVELPEGHTVLNISATEKQEVEQDLLVSSLRIQHESDEAKDVQSTINKAMAKALAEIKNLPSVKVETGSYYVHPDYRNRPREDGSDEQVIYKWRGSQTVTIKSEVAEDILKLTGALQEMGFMMNSLDYQLAPATYDKVRDSLMETTVAALMERAKRVGKALNKNTVDLVEINVDAQNDFPRPVYARAEKMSMMSADAAMPAPSAEAGETTVSMTISAKAVLKP